MAKLTKEKILQLKHEFVCDGASPWDVIEDVEWLKAQNFYYAGVHDFAEMLIEELEKKQC